MQGIQLSTLLLLLIHVQLIFSIGNGPKSEGKDKSLMAIKLKLSINKSFQSDLQNMKTETYKYYYTELTKYLTDTFQYMPGFSKISIDKFSGQEQTDCLFYLLLTGTLNLTQLEQNFHTCVERFQYATFDKEKINADETSILNEYSKAAIAQARNDDFNECSYGHVRIYEDGKGSCKPVCDPFPSYCQDKGCSRDVEESNGNCETGSSTNLVAIVGGSLGVVLVIVLTIWCFCRNCRNQDKNDSGKPGVNINCICCSQHAEGKNEIPMKVFGEEQSGNTMGQYPPPPPAYSKDDPNKKKTGRSVVILKRAPKVTFIRSDNSDD